MIKKRSGWPVSFFRLRKNKKACPESAQSPVLEYPVPRGMLIILKHRGACRRRGRLMRRAVHPRIRPRLRCTVEWRGKHGCAAQCAHARDGVRRRSGVRRPCRCVRGGMGAVRERCERRQPCGVCCGHQRVAVRRRGEQGFVGAMSHASAATQSCTTGECNGHGG